MQAILSEGIFLHSSLRKTYQCLQSGLSWQGFAEGEICPGCEANPGQNCQVQPRRKRSPQRAWSIKDFHLKDATNIFKMQ